jgi:hypothetical protein
MLSREPSARSETERRSEGGLPSAIFLQAGQPSREPFFIINREHLARRTVAAKAGTCFNTVVSLAEINVEDYVPNLFTALNQVFGPMGIRLDMEKEAEIFRWIRN